MWYVNPKTLEFEYLNPYTWCDLKELCARIIREGKLAGDHPAFKAWLSMCPDSNESNVLLLMATAFPQKALLSLTEFAERQTTYRRARIRCILAPKSTTTLVVGQEYWHLYDLLPTDDSKYLWSLTGVFVGHAPGDWFEPVVFE